MTFTASAAERIAACPGSAALPQANTTSEYAETGNEGHEAVCTFVEKVRSTSPLNADEALAECPEEWTEACHAIASLAHALIPEVAFSMDVEWLVGRFLGSNIARAYNLQPTEVGGTADLAGVTVDAAVIIDLKTGWGPVVPPERNRQLRLLALMAARAWGRCQARIAILRCPPGGTPSWQWAELDEVDLDQIAEETRSAMLAVDRARETVAQGRAPDVAEGAWCRYCPATPYCPAKTALIRRLASGAEGDELEMMIPLDARTAGLAWERIGHARRMLARVESACHAALAEFGALELPSGKLLKKVLQPGNERLDGDEVFNVALQLFGDDVANDSVERKATKSALEDAMRKRYGRGGAAKVRQVLDEVRKRGGATKPMTEKIVEIDP